MFSMVASGLKPRHGVRNAIHACYGVCTGTSSLRNQPNPSARKRVIPNGLNLSFILRYGLKEFRYPPANGGDLRLEERKSALAG